jgi:hypothetical protein
LALHLAYEGASQGQAYFPYFFWVSHCGKLDSKRSGNFAFNQLIATIEKIAFLILVIIHDFAQD